MTDTGGTPADTPREGATTSAGGTVERPLREVARTIWWMALIRAVLLVILGVTALVAPRMALLALVFVFGFYAILDGVTAVGMGVRARGADQGWGWIVAQGVVSVLAGIVALVWPGVTALALLFVIAFWAIVRGVAAIVEAVRTRRTHDRWIWTLVGGVVDIAFGVLLLVLPAAGILALLWLLGIFALVGGVVLAVLAFRIRALTKADAPVR